MKRVALLVTMPQRMLARAELGEQLGDAGKEPRLDADALGVEIEERLAQRLVLRRRSGLTPNAGVHQPARAGRGERAQALERQRLLALLAARMRFTARGQVRRGVGERAVEIEQDRAARHRARSAAGSSRRSRCRGGSAA